MSSSLSDIVGIWHFCLVCRPRLTECQCPWSIISRRSSPSASKVFYICVANSLIDATFRKWPELCALPSRKYSDHATELGPLLNGAEATRFAYKIKDEMSCSERCIIWLKKYIWQPLSPFLWRTKVLARLFSRSACSDRSRFVIEHPLTF